MNTRILSALAFAAATLLAPAAMAGEFGVSNSYGFSHRHGTGTTRVDTKVNSNLVENGKNFSAKTVHSQSGAGDAGNGYKDYSKVLSINTGSSHFSENTTTKVRANEHYSFGSQQFTHRTGSYFAQ